MAQLRSLMFHDDDSDEDVLMLVAIAQEEQLVDKSRRRNHKMIYRQRVEGHWRLYRDYFVDNAVYPPKYFRRRFRMSRPLLLKIQQAVEAHDPYFVQKKDCCGLLGWSSLQKVTAAMRVLAYGRTADSVDEYVRIGETTTIESLKRSVKAVVAIFGDEYLRSPNSNDIERLLDVAEQHGFPGRTPVISYSINNQDYTMRYNLADGIYPEWPVFVKTISSPQGSKNKLFAAKQESTRKDAERAFGVLQTRFAIVRDSAQFRDQAILKDIITTCIIMHNMIIEDERANGDLDFNYMKELVRIHL